MTGNPSVQNFSVSMQTSIPASIASNNDVIAFLNTPGQGLWNDTVSGALTINTFISMGLDVTSASVSASNWTASGGNAVLNFNLSTVSDPVTSGQVQSAVTAIFGLLLVGIGVAVATIGDGLPGLVFDALGALLVLAGAITLISVAVTVLASSPAGSLLYYGILGLAIVGGGLLLYSIAESPSARHKLASRAIS
jgi:hypothetical protein